MLKFIRGLINDNLLRAAALAIAAWAAARWAWAPSPQVVESLWAAVALLLGLGGAARTVRLTGRLQEAEVRLAQFEPPLRPVQASDGPYTPWECKDESCACKRPPRIV